MSARLYISNIHFQLTPLDIRSWLEKKDFRVRDVYVPKDRNYEAEFRNRGFCFVEMETVEDSEDAVDELPGELCPGGRPVNVKWADPRKPA
jgi:RNA recognition motif-containing protein